MRFSSFLCVVTKKHFSCVDLIELDENGVASLSRISRNKMRSIRMKLLALVVIFLICVVAPRRVLSFVSSVRSRRRDAALYETAVPSCADRLDLSRYRILLYSSEQSNDKQTRVGPSLVYPSLSRSSFPSTVYLWNDSFTHIDRLQTDS